MSEWVKLKTADKEEIEAYVARPKGEPIAGLVVVQEIFGVNNHIQSVADRYAELGYLVVAPALFDRVEKNVKLDYDKGGWEEAMRLFGKLDPEVSLKDVSAAVDFARAETGKKVGVVGYCYGGSEAWLAATRLDVQAAVGYYGGFIGKFAGEKVKAPVMLHFGSKDEHIPASVAEAAKAANPDIEVYWYDDAGHAFNRDADPTAFAPEAAKLALARTTEFFQKYLG
jgi:carboxymethylenebutenolidase